MFGMQSSNSAFIEQFGKRYAGSISWLGEHRYDSWAAGRIGLIIEKNLDFFQVIGEKKEHPLGKHRFDDWKVDSNILLRRGTTVYLVTSDLTEKVLGEDKQCNEWHLKPQGVAFEQNEKFVLKSPKVPDGEINFGKLTRKVDDWSVTQHGLFLRQGNSFFFLAL